MTMDVKANSPQTRWRRGLKWLTGRLSSAPISVPVTEKQQLGIKGERLAERFLRRKGYKLLARNVRISGGEMDRVFAAPDGAIVFVEVKTRRADGKWPGELAITRAKQRRLCQLAQRLARRRGWVGKPLRIDVVVVVESDSGPPQIRHHPSAVRLSA